MPGLFPNDNVLERVLMLQPVLGFDIGGANTKAVLVETTKKTLTLRGSTLKFFPIWMRSKDDLPALLSEIARDLGGRAPFKVCASITAELSDAYASKREGILHVISALQQAFPGVDTHIFTTQGRFLAPCELLENPLLAAAANWVATCRWVAEKYPDCIFVDAGSTTVDILPIIGNKIVTQDRTDLARLLNCELVYTGILRATIPSIAHRVPFRNAWCPISFEKFATMADVHLILGHIREDQYTSDTADGRPPGKEYAYARLARVICSDFEEIERRDVDRMARYLFKAQTRLVAKAIASVASRTPPAAPFVITGLGAECIGAPACSMADSCRSQILLNHEIGPKEDVLSSAYAVAWCYWHDFIASN